ncbi:sensor domain-containing diguanylate cyclase [Reinekea blandensis]|uniref:diguanylate cyclase n=1 Tax=Reinekea blandensis MED297 TaxID=314283 RepID=A4BD76_9GAMM|nr:GGDEF domain-containing protein [Reinekea blandensis]EAR09820.1 GGDEF domain protein [Reinekea sp. MED297] [Reinekea blandensis MED297]
MSEELNGLNRGTTSLTLMLMGFDHALDKKLVQLKAALREQPFHLDTFQDAMTQVETVYDELEGQTQHSIDTFRALFQQLLDEQGQTILSPLNKETPLLTDLLSIAEPLARHFRTLSRFDPAEPGSPDLEDVRKRLTVRFKALIETLMLMGDTSGTLTQLTSRLDENPNWSMLDELAQKTIHLLNDRLQEEKQQFEGYLSELNAKLTRIQQIVEADSTTLAELKELHASFNDSINAQMHEAREKIDRHYQVETLKSELLTSLDSIASRLEAYQSSYESKLQTLQKSKAEMTAHVIDLEKENRNLLTELHKERQLSMLDPLTGLPNRQGFDRRLSAELARAERYDQALSIAIIDIDFFKRINDEFGHLVGDKVLKMMAKEMKRVCRESDFLSRFGGEEFVLLLPQTTLEEGLTAVDKLRRHVETRPFHYQNTPVNLTVSAGVAQRQVNETLESWLDRADAALYVSKREGRNRVTKANQ